LIISNSNRNQHESIHPNRNYGNSNSWRLSCSEIKAVREDHFCDKVIEHARETHSASKNSDRGEIFKSMAVKICCLSETATNPLTGPGEP
jgi:hypothetical protein